MKCQSLFSGKGKKNIINLWSAEFAQRVVLVNLCLQKYWIIMKLETYTSRVERKTSVSQMVVFPQT